MSINTGMIHNNKRKLFPLFASSLLAVNLLTSCNLSKTNASETSNSKGAVTELNTKEPSQNDSKSVQTIDATHSGVAVAPSNSDKPNPNDNKSAVVEIKSGCKAKISFNYSGRSKIYDVSAVSRGSGFFVNSSGYIVTSNHIIERGKNLDKCKEALLKNYINQFATDLKRNSSELFNNRKIKQEIYNNSKFVEEIQLINTVRLPNGDRLPFEVKVAGQEKDVAVIKVETKNAPVLKLVDSEQVQIQDKIMAMGYPDINSAMLESKSLVEATTTSGEISAKPSLTEGSPVVFQINATLTRGNSGSPLLNNKGEVIGMITISAKNSNDQPVPGFAFASTSNTIMEFVRQVGVSNE